MMANRELTSREWQLLSAFLDDQLSKKEKLQVEELLQTRPDSREALEGLRRSKTILKTLPLRKAPRNFTLSAESARKKIIPSFTSVLRYSSALAGLLLIALLAFDFQSLRTPIAASRAMEDAAPEMLAMEAPTAEIGEAPPIIYWGAPPPVLGIYGKGGEDVTAYGIGGGGAGPEYGIGGGGQPGYLPPEAPLPEAVVPSEIIPLVEEAMPEAAEEAVPQMEKVPAPVALSGSEPILGVRPEDEQGAVTATSGEPILTRRLPAPSVSLRLIEVILAVLLVVTAIPAWLLRRK